MAQSSKVKVFTPYKPLLGTEPKELHTDIQGDIIIYGIVFHNCKTLEIIFNSRRTIKNYDHRVAAYAGGKKN